MQLSTDDLTFLARLAKSPDGARLVTLLQALLGDVEGQLRKLEGVQMHRAQGRALAFDELIDNMSDAEKKLNRNPPIESRRLRKVVNFQEA